MSLLSSVLNRKGFWDGEKNMNSSAFNKKFSDNGLLTTAKHSYFGAWEL